MWDVEATDEFADWYLRLYERVVPIADRLYDEHLDILKQEGLLP